MFRKPLILFAALLTIHSSFAQNHGHKTHEAEKTLHSGGANEFMHQASTEELIQRFESPERDAYQQPEKVMRYLGDISGKKIMDIGAGSGYFSVKLAKKGAQVIAADVNDEFLNYLKKRIAGENLSNIETRKIPFNNPDIKPHEVDMVFIVNTYHHIENRADYFARVKNGIKPTGDLVIIDFFKTEMPVGPPVNHKISIDQVITELKEAGFSTFQISADLLPYQYIIRAR